eukprot:CAMPEP_0179463940 /NCGR_PEP_ID=MMETSP0799-20121207/45874_1 /TAXON_ID=46947 /ORGANISM="Geminigera cryophila, Strain CCMP2564" /LENGTH=138 /DNA_ID=CAMNT_0021267461 /DNA_START=42 /DNA_END=454 /DNA_ORIENTATION=+
MPTVGAMYDAAARAHMRSEKPRPVLSTSHNLKQCSSLMEALETSAYKQGKSEDKLYMLLSKLPKDLPTLRDSWHTLKHTLADEADARAETENCSKKSSDWVQNTFIQQHQPVALLRQQEREKASIAMEGAGVSGKNKP